MRNDGSLLRLLSSLPAVLVSLTTPIFDRRRFLGKGAPIEPIGDEATVSDDDDGDDDRVDSGDKEEDMDGDDELAVTAAATAVTDGNDDDGADDVVSLPLGKDVAAAASMAAAAF